LGRPYSLLCVERRVQRLRRYLIVSFAIRSLWAYDSVEIIGVAISAVKQIWPAIACLLTNLLILV